MELDEADNFYGQALATSLLKGNSDISEFLTKVQEKADHAKKLKEEAEAIVQMTEEDEARLQRKREQQAAKAQK